jgi:hypothetical protein
VAGRVGSLLYDADSSGARRRRDGKPGGPGENGYSYPPGIKRRPVIQAAGRFDQPADARLVGVECLAAPYWHVAGRRPHRPSPSDSGADVAQQAAPRQVALARVPANSECRSWPDG